MSSSSADQSRGDAPWRREKPDGSITLEIYAQPGAKKSEVAGVHGDALKIRVAAPPVEGKANEALVAFIATSFGVPRRNVVILRGQSARRKTLVVRQPLARPDHDWELL